MNRLFLLLTIVAITSCQRERFVFTSVKEFELPLKKRAIWDLQLDYYCNGVQEYWTWVDTVSKCIQFQDIQAEQPIHSISLHSIDSIYDLVKYGGCNYYVHTIDSVFIFVLGRSIYLINDQGDMMNQWMVDSTDIHIGNRSYKYDRYPFKFEHSNHMMPLYYSDGKLYIRIIRMDRVASDSKLPSDAVGVAIDITQPLAVTNKTGHWPDLYQGNDFYYDNEPAWCINEKGQLIYAFPQDNYLYVYENDSLIKAVPAKSKYWTKPNPLQGSAMDVSNLKNYWAKEPRYWQLIWDRYRHRYYRLFSLEGKQYENEDGMTVKNIKPWSVMIFNEDFEILDEVIFDDAYTTTFFIPTKQGIWVAKNWDGKGDWNKLTLFQVTE